MEQTVRLMEFVYLKGGKGVPQTAQAAAKCATFMAMSQPQPEEIAQFGGENVKYSECHDRLVW